MRALTERHGARSSAVIAVDGKIGVINHVAITGAASRDQREDEGCVSWADAGKPSAISSLARIAARI